MSLTQHFLRTNEEILEHFFLHAEDGEEITIIEPTLTATGKLGTAQHAKPTVYKKIKAKGYGHDKTAASGEPGIYIINKDGEYFTTLYQTTPDKAPLVLSSGLLEANKFKGNPLAQAIAQHGQFHKVVAERATERNGLKSALSTEEQLNISLAQKCISALQKIWESVNHYDEGLTPEQNTAIILSKLSDLCEFYENMNSHDLSQNDHDRENTKLVKEKFRTAVTKSHAYCIKLGARMLEHVKSHPNDKKSVQAILASSRDEIDRTTHFIAGDGLVLSGSIMQAVHDLIKEVNTAAAKAVNAISLFHDRGESRRSIKRAEFDTRDMFDFTDYHNSAPRELSMLFDESTPKDKLIVIDMKKYGAKISSERDIALQLTILDSIQQTGKTPTGDKKPGYLGINWSDWSWQGVARTGSKFLAGLVGLVVDVPITLLDMLSVGQLFKLFDYKPEETLYLSERIENFLLAKVPDPKEQVYKQPNNFAGCAFGDTHNSITKITRRTPVSKFRGFVASQLKKLIADPVIELVKQVPTAFHAFQRIGYDWTVGTESVTDAEVTQLLQQKIAETIAHNEQMDVALETYVKRFNTEHPQATIKFKQKKLVAANDVKHAAVDSKADHATIDTSKACSYHDLETVFHQRAKHANRVLARSPRELDIDAPNDALSGSADGLEILFKVFYDEIYGLHPVPGMAFTFFGAFGGLPFISAALPAKIPFMMPFFDKMSAPIANALVGKTEGFTAGFSTALIEGKLAFCALDFFKRGPNSFIVNLTKDALENPAIAMLAGTFAWGLGYLVAFELNIPVISESIAEESKGSFSAPELMLTGAKFGALIAEGLIDLSERPESATMSLSDNLIQRITDEITQIYLTKHGLTAKDISDADKDNIQKNSQTVIDWMTKTSRNRQDVIQLVQAYKSEHENLLRGNPAALTKANNTIIELAKIPAKNLSAEFYLDIEKRFQERINRERLNQLAVERLSEKEKYRLMQWVEQKYRATAPEYVDAVHAKLYRKSRTSPIATTIRHAVDHVLELIRLLSLLVLVVVYGLTSHQKFIKAFQLFESQAIRYGKKALADLGLVFRFITKALLKTPIYMANAIITSVAMMVSYLITAPLALTEFVLRCLSYHLLKACNLPISIAPNVSFYLMKNILWGGKQLWQGIISILIPINVVIHYFEGLTNRLRSFAKTKNLQLASQDIDKRTELANKQARLMEKGMPVTSVSAKAELTLPAPAPQQVSLTSKLVTARLDAASATVAPMISVTEAKESEHQQPAVVLANNSNDAPAVTFHDDSNFETDKAFKQVEALLDAREPQVEQEKTFALLNLFANCIKNRLTYSADTIGTTGRNHTLRHLKIQCADVIRRDILQIDVNAKGDLASQLDQITYSLKKQLTLVHQTRFENQTDQGEFENQIQQGLLDAYQAISQHPVFRHEDRQLALTHLDDLITWNQHEIHSAIQFAFKEFIALGLPAANDNETDEIKHLRKIYMAIHNAKGSEKPLDEIVALVKNELNSQRLGICELHDQALQRRQAVEKSQRLFHRHPDMNNRQFVEKGYHLLMRGLAKLNLQFATQPDIHQKVMECYRSDGAAVRMGLSGG